jgi:hypothetical protein
MSTSLITPDGFPRADLDVAQSMSHFCRSPSISAEMFCSSNNESSYHLSTK